MRLVCLDDTSKWRTPARANKSHVLLVSPPSHRLAGFEECGAGTTRAMRHARLAFPSPDHETCHGRGTTIHLGKIFAGGRVSRGDAPNSAPHISFVEERNGRRTAITGSWERATGLSSHARESPSSSSTNLHGSPALVAFCVTGLC